MIISYRYTKASGNMEYRKLNKWGHNPLCRFGKLNFQELNIKRDFTGRVSRNYRKVLK